MSAKTKIIVLHMKEVIYTGIFLLPCCHPRLLYFFSMFGPGSEKKVPQPMPKAMYKPGI